MASTIQAQRLAMAAGAPALALIHSSMPMENDQLVARGHAEEPGETRQQRLCRWQTGSSQMRVWSWAVPTGRPPG